MCDMPQTCYKRGQPDRKEGPQWRWRLAWRSLEMCHASCAWTSHTRALRGAVCNGVFSWLRALTALRSSTMATGIVHLRKKQKDPPGMPWDGGRKVSVALAGDASHVVCVNFMRQDTMTVFWVGCAWMMCWSSERSLVQNDKREVRWIGLLEDGQWVERSTGDSIILLLRIT